MFKLTETQFLIKLFIYYILGQKFTEIKTLLSIKFPKGLIKFNIWLKGKLITWGVELLG